MSFPRKVFIGSLVSSLVLLLSPTFFNTAASQKSGSSVSSKKTQNNVHPRTERQKRRLENKAAYGKEYTAFVTPMYKGTYRLIASYRDDQSLAMVRGVSVFWKVLFYFLRGGSFVGVSFGVLFCFLRRACWEEDKIIFD